MFKKKKNEISWQKLSKIISNVEENFTFSSKEGRADAYKEQEKIRKTRLKLLGIQDGTYNLQLHCKWIEYKFKEMKLSHLIENDKKNPTKIVIKDAKIITGKEPSSYYDNLYIFRPTEHSWPEFEIEFKNCEFISYEEKGGHGNMIFISKDCKIIFRKCKSTNLGFFILSHTKREEPLRSSSYKIELYDNCFPLVHTDIVSGYTSNDRRPKITLRNNKMTNFQFADISKVNFESGNSIEEIFLIETRNEQEEIETNVYISPHQKIGYGAKHADNHRDIFLKLKKRAKEKEDYLQEQVLKREILRCERHFLRNQKLTKRWQDWFILQWGELISSHGVSWARPLGFILLLNAICALALIFLQGNIDYTKIGIAFFDFFNPTYFPDAENNLCIKFLIAIQKIIFFALVYEAIRAGRRFSRW